MKVIFESRKGVFIYVIIAFLLFILSISLFNFSSFNDLENHEYVISSVLIILSLSLLLWMYFDTKYELTATNLNYKSGPIKGTIEIQKINTILLKKTLWSGTRPALASNGLVIKFGTYDEIYISPETNESFVKELSKINKNIEIVQSN